MNPIVYWLCIIHLSSAVGVLAVMELDYWVYWRGLR